MFFLRSLAASCLITATLSDWCNSPPNAKLLRKATRFASTSGLVILGGIAVWQEQGMLQLMIDSKRRLAYSGSL